MKKQVATENAEVRTIEWYEENLAKAEKEWSEIAKSYGAKDFQLVDLGYGEWVIILNVNAAFKETICEEDGDFETITDKQVCDRLTYLNNVIDGWRKKIREMKEAQEKINKIGRLINVAQCSVYFFSDDLANELREAKPSYYDEDEECFLYWEEIRCLKDLCDELNIDVPLTCDVYFLEDGNYRVETVGGDKLLVCADIEVVKIFLQGWVYSCANSVIQQAQERIGNLYKRIGNLLETGC